MFYLTPSPEVLLRRLRTLEQVIREMLRLGRATSILREKLHQTEQMVFQLSQANSQVAVQWRDKLATWWRLYVSYKKKVIALSTSTSSTTTASSSSERLSIWRTSILRHYDRALYAILEKPFDDQLSRYYVLSQLQSAYHELPDIYSDVDLYGMQLLLCTVVQTFDYVPPTDRDESLQRSVFQFAFVKLPILMCDHFATLYSRPYSLFQLFRFLRLEIEAYRDNNKLLLLSTDALNKFPKEQVFCLRCFHFDAHTDNQKCPGLDSALQCFKQFFK